MFQGESSLDSLNDLIYFHPRNKVSSEVPDDDGHIYSNNLISLFLHKFRNIRAEDASTLLNGTREMKAILTFD